MVKEFSVWWYENGESEVYGKGEENTIQFL